MLKANLSKNIFVTALSIYKKKFGKKPKCPKTGDWLNELYLFKGYQTVMKHSF